MHLCLPEEILEASLQEGSQEQKHRAHSCPWRPSSSPVEEGVENAETQSKRVGKPQGLRSRGCAQPCAHFPESLVLVGSPKMPLPSVLCVFFIPSLFLNELTYSSFSGWLGG